MFVCMYVCMYVCVYASIEPCTLYVLANCGNTVTLLISASTIYADERYGTSGTSNYFSTLSCSDEDMELSDCITEYKYLCSSSTCATEYGMKCFSKSKQRSMNTWYSFQLLKLVVVHDFFHIHVQNLLCSNRLLLY